MGFGMGILMAILGGPFLAWLYTTPGVQAKFDERKQKFAAGQGKDPEADFIGPHKSFQQNMIMGALLFFVIGIAAGLGAGLVI